MWNIKFTLKQAINTKYLMSVRKREDCKCSHCCVYFVPVDRCMDLQRSRYCTGTDIYIDNYRDMLFDLYNYEEIYRKEKNIYMTVQIH